MGTEITHVLDSLGWAVLHSIWQGGLAFLFVIIWRTALRERSPAFRHAGQIMALMGCMIAFFWTFAVYLGLPNIVTNSGATLPAANANEAPRLWTGLMAPFDPASAQASLSLSRITPILACLWALGFAAMSLRYAFAFGQVQQLRTLGIQRPDATWTQRFMQLAQDIGVSEKVRLYVTANVAGPMTLGLIKPVVLVPVGFLTGLPVDQVEAILRHELAHIRRYDYALNLIQTAVKTVLFYHPAIHIICRWADQDREQACDDLAVREGRDPLTLARGLATLRLQAQPTFSMAATGSDENMPLMNRLTRLAGQTPKRGRPEHIFMSVLSALLLGSVYLGSSSRAEAHPVPPTVPDTVISVRNEAPVPPVPPVLMEMDFYELQDDEALQNFIEKDKAAYKIFARKMKNYSAELEAFLENSIFDEDEHENFREHYSDFADDISDMFEDRREAIEDHHEAQIERQMEAQEYEIERRAEALGIEAALKGLEAAERAMSENPNAFMKEALKKARKEIAHTQKEARMAVSQAETHRSVAIAKARSHKVHTEIDRESQKHHEAFRDKIISELLKDGVIKPSTETVTLSHPKNTMIVNGQTLPKALKGKYCGLWDKYGFTDGQSEVTIKPESLTILTDWKDGQHTTRVTYGTF